MILADAYVAASLEQLRRDLCATGCGQYTNFVAERAADVATFETEPRRFVELVVDDVQQRLHDEFIDTTWPQCPRHANHPLDYAEGAWRCPSDGVVVALLGLLK
jgi:hypothetical protein